MTVSVPVVAEAPAASRSWRRPVYCVSFPTGESPLQLLNAPLTMVVSPNSLYR